MKIKTGQTMDTHLDHCKLSTPKKHHFILMSSIFAIFALCRLGSVLVSQNWGGDAIIRVWMAKDWLHDPFYIWAANDTTWVFGPLHTYLIALMIKIWDNTDVAPRVLSLISGLLAFFPFYYILKLRFSRDEIYYSLAFFSLYPLHIQFSSVATSEVLTVLFVLCGLACFFSYQDGRRISTLVACAVSFDLAAMMRYDVWIYIIIVFGLLVFDSIEDKLILNKALLTRTIIFLGIASVFPIMWLLGNYVQNHDPLYFLNVAISDHMATHLGTPKGGASLTDTLYALAYWPLGLAFALTPVVLLLSLLGLGYFAFESNSRGILLILLLPALIFNYETIVQAKMKPDIRYLIITGTLLLLFSGRGILALTSRPYRLPRRAVIIAVILSNVLFDVLYIRLGSLSDQEGYRSRLARVAPITRLPLYWNEIIDWIVRNVDSGDCVILDSVNYSELPIIFYSGKTKDQFIVPGKDKEKFCDLVFEKKPRYLICLMKGNLVRFFHFRGNLSDVCPYQSTQVMLVGKHEYVIYELCPEPER